MDDATAFAAVQRFTSSPTASDALSQSSHSLTLSISFAVANELLDAGRDAELGEAELIGIVLAASIVLGTLPSVLSLMRTEVAAAWAVAHGRKPCADDTNSGTGSFAFLALFVKLSQRITMSICVQLIAANVRVHQPLRSVRVLTLIGVAVFFVFLESTATIGGNQRSAR